MSRATDVAGRVGRTLLIAVLVSPAVWPVGELFTSAGELTGAAVPNWVLPIGVLGVAFALGETYGGPTERLLPTALLTAVLFVGAQWLVGLRGANAISMRLLAANALVYLAALSGAIAITFETGLWQRITSRFGGADVDTGE